MPTQAGIRRTLAMGRWLDVVPFRQARYAARRKCVEKEHQMKHYKDIEACLALLRALHAGNDIEPEQKRYVETAIKEAKRLRRKRSGDLAATYRCVRRITENLLCAFLEDQPW
jgi:hypothetical protein